MNWRILLIATILVSAIPAGAQAPPKAKSTPITTESAVRPELVEGGSTAAREAQTRAEAVRSATAEAATVRPMESGTEAATAAYLRAASAHAAAAQVAATQALTATTAKERDVANQIATTEGAKADAAAAQAAELSRAELLSSRLYGFGVMGFGILILVLVVSPWAQNRGRWENFSYRLFGLSLVIIAALFVIVAGYSETQITPVFGILGTALGYILGKENPTSAPTSGEVANISSIDAGASGAGANGTGPGGAGGAMDSFIPDGSGADSPIDAENMVDEEPVPAENRA